MIRQLVALALLALPTTVAAQVAGAVDAGEDARAEIVAALADATAGVGAPERVRALIVFGQDACPPSTDDEVVICARRDENERYRLPKEFRHSKPNVAQGSWAATARTLDYVSRVGLPDSCSPVGSGGATGCYRQFVQQWAAERREAKREAEMVP